MSRILPALVALPLIVAFGMVEGAWTGRWVHQRAPEEAAARLEMVPMSFGEWDGVAKELDPRQVAKAELSGHALRRYVHRTSGANLSVLLVAGRSGPVAVHTPDVCYGGVGFDLVAPPVSTSVNTDGASAFKVGSFKKVSAPVPEYLRVFWAWSTDGKSWTAPDNPRLTFGGAPALYKLYVIRQMADANESPQADPCVDFLRQFLPMVEKSLAASHQTADVPPHQRAFPE
jgi:hypothetical protein